MEPATIWIALIAGIVTISSTVIGPIVATHFTNRALALRTAADYKRQDEVADRLLTQQQAVATKLTARQDKIALQAAEAAELLLAANERVAKASADAKIRLDQIHTLVNANLSAAIQEAADAIRREIAMMSELMDLKRSLGQEPRSEERRVGK